jgi:hypothetical protein
MIDIVKRRYLYFGISFSHHSRMMYYYYEVFLAIDFKGGSLLISALKQAQF